MSKGGYAGGSTVIGFGRSWHVEPRSPADQKRDQQEDEDRKAALKLKKKKKKKKKKKLPPLSKSERTADFEARKHFREAPKHVLVERRVGDKIFSVGTIKRS